MPAKTVPPIWIDLPPWTPDLRTGAPLVVDLTRRGFLAGLGAAGFLTACGSTTSCEGT